MAYNQTTSHRVCMNCVMDTTDRNIKFDINGLCDHCLTFENHTKVNWLRDKQAQAALKKTVDKIKKEGEGKEFDCLIGISGGLDSSYLAHVAKRHLGLRPLVFHVDAGWNSNTAVNNIEKIVDGLELDLYTHVVDWEIMKDLQLSFFKSGVPHIDTPQDHAFFAVMYHFAHKHNIKNILTGANLSTECVRNPVEWMYYQSDLTQIKDIHNKFGTKDIKLFPTTSILWHKFYLPYFKGIKVQRLLDLVEYNKGAAAELLSSEYGWTNYPQKHFESRFTEFFESYWLPKRFGFDVRKVQYSSLILTDQMKRDEALSKLKMPPWSKVTENQLLPFVANKLGISVAELNGYLNLPKRSYDDYRSQKLLYQLGARFLHLIGKEVGGKR